MEREIRPEDLRNLLLSVVRAAAPPPSIRPGCVVTCNGTTVARRSMSGELTLRCYRAAHGVAAQYEAIQAALCKLVGALPACQTCGGVGWLAIDGREAREAALKALAFGAYRGVRFEALASGNELLKQSNGLVDLLGGGRCGSTPH